MKAVTQKSKDVDIVKIHEAAENYLETIYIVKKRLGYCRSIDVCNELGYSKPTVSVVMKDFRQNGYVVIDSHGDITLTEKGLKVAERMYERHQLLGKMLIDLGVDDETAYADACNIEHDLSEESFSKIKEHYSKMKK